MFAKIIEDHIDCTDVLGDDFQRKDLLLFSDIRPTRGTVLVRVLDDDRIPYYDLVADDDNETLECVLEWCMNDAGATILQLKDETGAWRDHMN